MKRPRAITGIVLAAAVFLVLGTGVAVAYGTGYRSGWCPGPASGQSGATAQTQSYRGAPSTQTSTAGITAQPTQAVPPCPGPGWCWDAVGRSWTPPAGSGNTTSPGTALSAASPSSPGWFCSGGCCGR